MTKEEVLQKCTVSGNFVKLLDVQLDRKEYEQVAKALNLIGGNWKGGKVKAFVFKYDPTDLLKQIAGGEKVNLKKEYQFFATPDDLADYLVKIAFTEPFPLGAVLEPSAGQGAIIQAIHRIDPDIEVNYCELMDINRSILSNSCSPVNYLGDDFFNLPLECKFATIIANPPFSKNQDIDHIRKMYDHLEPGGRLVTISSKHWQISSNKKETQFLEWLDSMDTEIEEIEPGRFKSSGTMVGGLIITINK